MDADFLRSKIDGLAQVCDLAGLEGNIFSSWALFDGKHRYRYALGRHWNWGLPVFVWVMLNPSKAGAREDDPTIRKVIGFTSRNGGGGAVVVNLAAYVTSYPKELLKVEDPVGPRNRTVLEAILGLPDVRRVVAWGADATRLESRLWASMRLSRAYSPLCLGKTTMGEPRHPSRIGYDTPLVPYI